jgi:hypothetical protein
VVLVIALVVLAVFGPRILRVVRSDTVTGVVAQRGHHQADGPDRQPGRRLSGRRAAVRRDQGHPVPREDS